MDGPADMEATFKALADPTRRLLLDRLRRRGGQSLTQVCTDLDMTRQSATQHLDILRSANLVIVMRRGRERLHYLNPVPIQDIERRWLADFDRPRLDDLNTIKHRAEELAMNDTDDVVPTYAYATYIRAHPEQVFQALTDADLTARYWGHANVSDWQPGSRWEHRRADGSGEVDGRGRVLEVDPPNRLVITFEDTAGDEALTRTATVTFTIEAHVDIVRLTVVHTNLPDAQAYDAVAHGWPAVLANLKSLLETGEVLPQNPWEMNPVTS